MSINKFAMLFALSLALYGSNGSSGGSGELEDLVQSGITGNSTPSKDLDLKREQDHKVRVAKIMSEYELEEAYNERHGIVIPPLPEDPDWKDQAEAIRLRNLEMEYFRKGRKFGEPLTRDGLKAWQ